MQLLMAWNPLLPTRMPPSPLRLLKLHALTPGSTLALYTGHDINMVSNNPLVDTVYLSWLWPLPISCEN